MAIATLTVWPFSNVTNFQGLGQSLDVIDAGAGWSTIGDTDYAACLAADNDGKYIRGTNSSFAFFFQNSGVGGPIPGGSTINSVKFQVRLRTNGGSIDLHAANVAGPSYQLVQGGGFLQNFTDLVTAPADPATVPAFTTYETTTYLTNPNTAVAWVLADLFANLPNDPNDTGGYWFLTLGVIGASSIDVDSFFLVVDYSRPAQTLNIDLPSLSVIAATGGFPPDPIVGGVNSGGVGDSIYVAGGPNPSVTVSVPGYPGGLPYGRPGGYPVGVGTPPSGTPPQGPGSYASDLNQWRLERFDFQVRHEEHKG